MKYGGEKDVQAIKIAICSGVQGIFTAHGRNLEEIIKNPELNQLITDNIIEKVIQLSKIEKGKVEKIYDLSNKSNIYINQAYNMYRT